ncbi:HypC/HybG/HupF family hydrogenase formation chaperone, partial [Candidatus Bipolaricaulota bacterium]|nr:HypC/HybG/HupF family hydrogenase formation chaperone [Candidatus Bipolaricaulota bacterium]
LDTLTEPLAPGDYVLIHTGFAIRRMSAADGEETLKLFDELADSLGENAIRSDDANSDQQADPSSLENASHSPVPDTAQQADPSSHSPASHSAESPRGRTDEL